MTARAWFAAAMAGAFGGALAAAIWTWADDSVAGCTDDFCPIEPPALAWLLGPPLVGLVGWLLVRILGSGRWLAALATAALGSLVGLLGLWAWVAFADGTPRPPWVVAVVAGVAGYVAATALVHSGRWARIGAAAFAGVLVVTVAVGSLTSPARDRDHAFAAVAEILLGPDPAAFRVVSADADPAHRAVLLRLEPVGGGPAIALTESTRPTGWQPPVNCGPQLRFTVALGQKPIDNPCEPYAGGGWQRAYPSGPHLVDLRGATLVVIEPWDPTITVPASTLRGLIEGLRPARPADFTGLPGTT